MKMKSRDYWKPQPGSWEEAVDPYDVQRSRVKQASMKQERDDIPFRTLDNHKTPPPIPMTF
ncbi:MAG: hypothetical protein ACYC7E_19145 [Armatimonadota bacterium]